MSTTRSYRIKPFSTYSLPPAGARRRLVEEIARAAEEVLGYPARPACVAAWCAMADTELRRCRDRWALLVASRRAPSPARPLFEEA